MRVDINKLRGKMYEQKMTQTALAKELGIDSSTMYRKMKCDALAFSVGEMHLMVRALSLTPKEATDIFFSEYSQ